MELAIPVESNGLGLGIHELTAITHVNGSSNSDDFEFIFDLEVVAPTRTLKSILLIGTDYRNLSYAS